MIPLPAGRWRPCGVCRQLVGENGCRHWKPGIQVDAATTRRLARNAERKRQTRAAAREAAKKAVDDFARTMGAK